MEIKLKSYSDCGKCSFGSLISEEGFDTDRDVIKLNGKIVEINSVEDLFPFLWTSYCGFSKDNGKIYYIFNDTGYWWDWYYKNPSQETYDKLIKNRIESVENQKERLKVENGTV